MDFSKQLFRCSSLGNLMTNQQGKKDTTSIEQLSETAKGELIKIFVREVYGRDKEIVSKYTTKGLAVEEDSITLLSRVKKQFFKKNEERKENEFITGEVDIQIPSLYDTKSCWDLHTFMAAKTSQLKKDYKYQMLGYCELYDQPFGTIAFTLIDTPQGLIEEEKRRLFYKMNVPTMENPDYIEACEQLQKEMTFQDIPMEDRLHEVIVKRHPEEMESVYTRVPIWREFLSVMAENSKLVPA